MNILSLFTCVNCVVETHMLLFFQWNLKAEHFKESSQSHSYATFIVNMSVKRTKIPYTAKKKKNLIFKTACYFYNIFSVFRTCQMWSVNDVFSKSCTSTENISLGEALEGFHIIAFVEEWESTADILVWRFSHSSYTWSLTSALPTFRTEIMLTDAHL